MTLYTTKSKGYIDYLFLASEKFKFLTLSLTFTLPLEVKSAAHGALIPGVLCSAAERYPSMKALVQHCEDLYGASLYHSVVCSGRQQYGTIGIRFPDPACLLSGTEVYRSVLDLAYELIMNPLTVGGKEFSKDIFESEKAQLLQSIENLVDEKQSYVLRKLAEISIPESSYSLPEYGSKQEVEKASAFSTYQYFKQIRESASLTIALSGPMKEKKYLFPLMETFETLKRTKPKEVPLNQPFKKKLLFRVQEERQVGLHQGVLGLSFQTGINLASPEFSCFQFCDAIFGRLSSSRLFKVIREEFGLAYSIGSFIQNATGLNFVYASCDSAQLQKVEKMVFQELQYLQESGITEAEFEGIRSSLIEEYLNNQDSSRFLIAQSFIQRSCGIAKTSDEILEAIKKVKRSQVQECFKAYRALASYRLF